MPGLEVNRADSPIESVHLSDTRGELVASFTPRDEGNGAPKMIVLQAIRLAAASFTIQQTRDLAAALDEMTRE